MLIIRLIWACHIPLGNDEAYYWDWARNPEISYIDHPAGVSWIAMINGQFGFLGPISARAINPFIHLFASIFIGFCGRFLFGPRLPRGYKRTWFVVTQWLPGFSLGGILLLPDLGLLLCLSIAMFQGIRVITRRRLLRARDGMVLGLAYGFAGLFKYMALPVAMGGLLAIGIARWRGDRRENGFWIGTVVTALVVVSPVFMWNSTHHWASIRFQAAHGFSDSAFAFLPAARFWLGLIVLISPWLFWQICLECARYGQIPALNTVGDGDGLCGERRVGATFLVWSAVPLALLLFFQAFFKQLLPHWLIPTVWVLLPLLMGAKAATSSLLRKRVIVYGGVFVLGASLFSFSSIRRNLVIALDQTPGPLGELTFWEPLARAVESAVPAADVLQSPHSSLDCAGGKKVLGTLRWFWASQLSLNFPGQPEVLSLDMNHPSYYHQRNDLRDFEGCPVVVVGDARHVDRQILSALMDITKESTLNVWGHRDVSTVLIEGYLRPQRAVEAYPLAKGI